MNSTEMFDKITKRNKYVMCCGSVRNSAYLKYLTTSLNYDTLKKGFYTAMELSKIDGNISEDGKPQLKHI